MTKIATLQLTRNLRGFWVDQSAPPTQRQQNLGDLPPLFASVSRLAQHLCSHGTGLILHSRYESNT
jgi:hypothetical protein